MADRQEPHLQNPVDRYARGELTAREARALAQQSLDDPELFEDLTFQAVVKNVLSSPSATQRLNQAPLARVTRFPSRIRIFMTCAGAAAAVVLLSFYFLKSTQPQQNQPSASKS